MWTGELPHLSGLTHLSGVPHLHVNRSLGGHPVLSEHYNISQGCPLNTGFTAYGRTENTSGNPYIPL